MKMTMKILTFYIQNIRYIEHLFFRITKPKNGDVILVCIRTLSTFEFVKLFS